MIVNIIWTVLLAIAAGILQSTVLGNIAVYGVVPDLALCIVVYSAYVNGTMTGQVSGFFSGLLLDFLSAAPMGLNCLVRTLIGAITGAFKGTLFLDHFFLPIVLCALATIVKALLLFFLNLIFGQAVPTYVIISPTFWIELGFNALSAPLLFFLLRRIKFLTPPRGVNV